MLVPTPENPLISATEEKVALAMEKLIFDFDLPIFKVKRGGPLKDWGWYFYGLREALPAERLPAFDAHYREFIEAVSTYLGSKREDPATSTAGLERSLLLLKKYNKSVLLEHSAFKDYPSGAYGRFKKAYPIGQAVPVAEAGQLMGVKIQKVAGLGASSGAAERMLEVERKTGELLGVTTGHVRRAYPADGSATHEKDYTLQVLLPGVSGTAFKKMQRGRKPKLTLHEGNRINKIATSMLASLLLMNNKKRYHRDIKPDNCTVDLTSNCVFFLDFGQSIAFHLDAPGQAVKTYYQGTYGYSSAAYLLCDFHKQKYDYSFTDDLISAALTLVELFSGPKAEEILTISAQEGGQYRISLSRYMMGAQSDAMNENVSGVERNWMALLNFILATHSLAPAYRAIIGAALVHDAAGAEVSEQLAERLEMFVGDHLKEHVPNSVRLMSSGGLNALGLIDYLSATGLVGPVLQVQAEIADTYAKRIPHTAYADSVQTAVPAPAVGALPQSKPRGKAAIEHMIPPLDKRGAERAVEALLSPAPSPATVSGPSSGRIISKPAQKSAASMAFDVLETARILGRGVEAEQGEAGAYAPGYAGMKLSAKAPLVPLSPLSDTERCRTADKAGLVSGAQLQQKYARQRLNYGEVAISRPSKKVKGAFMGPAPRI